MPLFKRKKIDINRKLGDADLNKWIKKQVFDSEATYLITVGNEKHPATQEQIRQLGEVLEMNTRGTRFVIVPHTIKLVRLEKRQEVRK